jgi:hypothetical protein
MLTPIQRIDLLENRVAELETYKAMLDELREGYEAHRKVQELRTPDPTLKPQEIPAGVPVAQTTEELAAVQPGVDLPSQVG